jgi:hypothetical protein
MTDIDTSSLKDFGKKELPATYVPKVATLRDQFAMAALTGLMAISPAKQSLEGIAEFSYIAADAMLRAREAK